MKVLQLNVWMGKVEGNLQRFLEQNDFDIICMQEVFASDDCELHLSRLCFDRSRIIRASRLPYAFFAPNFGSVLADGHLESGNLILSRFPIAAQSSTFVHGAYEPDLILGAAPKNNLNIMSITLENGLTIINHHGFWRPDPLGDEDTVRAFERAAEFVREFNSGPLVMCGDLNVIHSSPAMRPLDFLRDLTDEAKLPTTLSGLKYDGAVPCDHILVNDKVEVRAFVCLPDLVSDHLALLADIEIK